MALLVMHTIFKYFNYYLLVYQMNSLSFVDLHTQWCYVVTKQKSPSVIRFFTFYIHQQIQDSTF